MRTPYGVECKFYYEDYMRGRATQECRLLAGSPQSGRWKPRLCKSCPVPAILRANACPNMLLEGRIGRRWLVVEQIQVNAHCRLAGERVDNPMVGCGRCHENRWQDIVVGPPDS